MYTNDEIREKYNRIANAYDFIQSVVEFGARKKRRELLRHAYSDVLEVGVGTGRTLSYYPPNCKITAIDYNSSMLETAREKASKLGKKASFILMDAGKLGFPDHSFDIVVDTLCMCTYPNPINVLKEMKRVCKSNGRILLLEHGRSSNRYLEWLQKKLASRQYEMLGCNAFRDHIDLVKKAGLNIGSLNRSGFGIYYSIVAKP